MEEEMQELKPLSLSQTAVFSVVPALSVSCVFLSFPTLNQLLERRRQWSFRWVVPFVIFPCLERQGITSPTGNEFCPVWRHMLICLILYMLLVFVAAIPGSSHTDYSSHWGICFLTFSWFSYKPNRERDLLGKFKATIIYTADTVLCWAPLEKVMWFHY